MNDIEITIPAGEAKRLLVAGKRHTRNIKVTAEGGTDRYDEGYSDGKEAGRDAFWDAFQENGNRRTYNWAFFGTKWVDACFNPKYDIIIEGDATNAFAQTGITDTKVTIDISNCSNTTGLFNNSLTIKTIRKLKVSENTFS